MPVCDMCGSESNLFRTEIEGTMLNVCKNCSKFGKVKSALLIKENIKKSQKQEFTPRPPISKEQLLQKLVDNFSEIIKKKRESLNLKQEEFAKKINEKVSLIQKIESGNFTPSIKFARKIEKFLKITLIEQYTSDKPEFGTSDSPNFTLGDYIKIKD